MSALLELHEVDAFYGAAHILHRLSLRVEAGERVALIGRNGVGKTTVVNTILGLAQMRHGQVSIGGKAIARPRPYIAAQQGVVVVPQGRRIIANLTVEENLLLGAATGQGKGNKGPWNVPEIYKLFPILKERAHTPGTALSGGQQQMLAVGRALMAGPKLLMMDEPSLGLAPLVVRDIFAIIRQLSLEGITILLIEQNANAALRAADRGYVMETGRIILSGTGEDLLSNQAVRDAYLGQSAKKIKKS